MKVGELKELLDGLQDDRFIGITINEDVFAVGKIIAERSPMTNTEHLKLIAFDSYTHNRYLSIEDLKYAIEKCSDDTLIFAEIVAPLPVDEFRHGNFYVN